MINTHGQYWFFINPNVYVVNRLNKVLLYNTTNAEYIETDNPNFIALTNEIYNKKNLGVVRLNSIYLTDFLCYNLIKCAIEKYIAGYIEVDKYEKKPIVLLPILCLQWDIEKMVGDNASLIGDEVMSYLTKINLFINDSCNLECPHCNSYFRQTKFCTKKGGHSILMPDSVNLILQQVQHTSISRINILGGNLLLYPYWSQLKQILNKYRYEYHFFEHYKNVSNTFNFNVDNIKKDVLINFPIEEHLLFNQFHLLNEENTTYHFIIENEKQYDLANDIILKYHITNYVIVPFFTGDNYSFFQHNIFMDKEDILAEPILQRKIFCNQKLNSNHFGTLNIMPDGDVKANLNNLSLGNIHKESFPEIIYNELVQNTAWRKIRNNEPCNNCLYQFLCPPISNYELAMKKTNLCNIML